MPRRKSLGRKRMGLCGCHNACAHFIPGAFALEAPRGGHASSTDLRKQTLLALAGELRLRSYRRRQRDLLGMLRASQACSHVPRLRSLLVLVVAGWRKLTLGSQGRCKPDRLPAGSGPDPFFLWQAYAGTKAPLGSNEWL